MKKLLVLLLLASISFTAYSKSNFAIHGKITHPISDSIKISFSETSIIYHLKEYGARLSSDGSFNIAIDIPQGYTKIGITHGNQQTEIFSEPGSDLEVFIDAANFDSTLHFSGKGSDLANFMAKHVIEKQSMLNFSIQSQMLCNKEPQEFEEGLKELEKAELDFLQKNDRELPASFKDYFKAYFRYKVYAAMETYPHFHEMRKQNTMRVKDIPKEDYVVVDHIPDAFNDKYIDMEAYQEFLYNFFAVKLAAEKAGDTETNKNPTAEPYLTLAYKKMPPKTAEFYAGRVIYQFTKYTAIDKTESEFEEYKSHFPHGKFIPELERTISIRKTIAVGKPAIDFEINTPDGKKMRLSDLKGKVVYLDFWSSGCVPCLAEMPDAKKIRAYFKDKPVAFVNVSIDPHDDTWKYSINKYEVDGINTRENGEWESETVKKYGIKGIPSYYLIDKEGKFAIVENIARPSNSSKLIAQIENLLK